MKWTKKDIGIMCGAISSFWLYNRPLSGSQEMVDRFMGLSAQDERDVSKGLKLLDRIRANGLPPEVVSFDPTTVRRY